MLLIIALMVAGIALGALVFSRGEPRAALKFFEKIQQIATIILLFVMGIWLGGNTGFWDNIKTMGLRGFLFAAVTIAGSVFFVFLFSKIIIKGQKP